MGYYSMDIVRLGVRIEQLQATKNQLGGNNVKYAQDLFPVSFALTVTVTSS